MRIVHKVRVALYNVNKYSSKFNLDLPKLAGRFSIVQNGAEADYVLCWKNRPVEVPEYKCVLFQSEPPIASNIMSSCRASSEFLGYYCFDPDAVPNGRPFTSDPLCYPYSPAVDKRLEINVSDHSPVKFYFAGKKGSPATWRVPQHFGSKCIYQHRFEIASALKDMFPYSLVVGEGFPESTKNAPAGWRSEKYNDMLRAGSNYIFCCENAIIKNYFSEKIHDGFNSGRVFAYFGAPNVLDFVPEDCFIDVRRFMEGDQFHQKEFKRYIELLTPQQYVRYAENAKSFSSDFNFRHAKAKSELTDRVIELLLDV